MPRNDLIQVRSDTSSNWTSVNPILATGEIGFESNTGKFKIGTGSTAWSSLPYTSDTAGSATTAGTVTTAAQPAITSAVNLTSVGTLSALDVTGVFEVSPSVNHTLYVSANRVGVRTNTPQGAFDVNGTAFATIFSGSGASLNSIPYTALTGTVPTWNQNTTGTAASAASVPASGITDQTGMWTSANRPGPYRLYRNDNDSDYNVQTYYTGSKWRLYGYNGNTAHADTHVGYADRADTADTWTTARTISLTGDVTGSDSISGSGNISISATIGSGKVTAAMIAANAVTASEIASGAITNSEVSGTAAIALSKLATTGTMTATTFSGSGSSLTSIPAGQLTGTVASARISGAYNGITDIGTLSSGLSVTTNIYATGDMVLSTGGTEFVATAPTVGGSSPANWVLVGSQYRLYRSSSTKDHKENIQNLGTYLTPDMIDPINIQLWNRKTAPGIPEVGPMAEDMHDISPFLSSRGMIWDENGEPIPSPVDGINNNTWMSLLTIGMQDIRQRLAKLENPEV